MSTPFTLPLLGGSLLAAVAVGIHLGESSIGLIKPIYFQGPAPHPRDRGAALDESLAPPPARATYASLYGWDEGNAALAATCVDCEAPAPPESRNYSAVVPYFGDRETAASRRPDDGPDEPRLDEAYGTQWPVRAAELEPRDRNVVRYAHYPITEAELEHERSKRKAPADVEPGAERARGYDRRRASYQEADVWIEPDRPQRWER